VAKVVAKSLQSMGKLLMIAESIGLPTRAPKRMPIGRTTGTKISARGNGREHHLPGG
jgi:hypothetical protein